MKKSIIFFLVTAMLLAGCENSAPKDAQSNAQQTKASGHSNSESANHDEANGEKYVATAKNEKGQTFRVISAYKWVNQYVQKAKDTNNKSKRWELWRKIVMDHVQDQCLSGAYSHLVQNYVYSPPQHFGKLKYDIKLLKAANTEETTFKALKASAEKLPGPDTTVCLLPQGNSHNLGVTLDAGKISIFYSPSFNKTLLKSTVAHEYHHSAWKAQYAKGYKWDLLGSVIFEGKAEYFASLLYEPSAVKGSYMNKKKEGRLWTKIKDSLHTTNQDRINTVLFGGTEFPFNFGYVAGYHIVRDYVETHPNTSIKDWSKLSPEKLYKKSGYEDSF